MKRFLFIVGVLLLAAAVGGWLVWHRLRTPYRGFAEEGVFVELTPGIGVTGIAGRLADAGVVADSLTFRLAVYLAHADRHLRAGEYRFVDAATPAAVIDRLTKGDVYTRPVTFPEGETFREMAAVFERSGAGQAADFQRAASDGSLVAGLDPDAPNLEGYLFPDTYPLPRRASAADAVRAMVARFERVFDAGLRAEAAARQLGLREVVTLASIIEKETARADERPLVSAVYQNRLKAGMALQCDPTVIYAVMQTGRWHGNLTRADLQIDSPYNTYRYPGLPPGPIASPGRAALEAALRPAPVPYLYFVSRNDGSHVFATTLAEHNRNVQKYQVKYFKK